MQGSKRTDRVTQNCTGHEKVVPSAAGRTGERCGRFPSVDRWFVEAVLALVLPRRHVRLTARVCSCDWEAVARDMLCRLPAPTPSGSISRHVLTQNLPQQLSHCQNESNALFSALLVVVWGFWVKIICRVIVLPLPAAARALHAVGRLSCRHVTVCLAASRAESSRADFCSRRLFARFKWILLLFVKDRPEVVFA